MSCSKLAIPIVHQVAALLSSPSTLNRLQQLLKNVFEFGRELCAALIGKIDELRSKNVKLRADYRKYTSMLNDLREIVIEYIDVARSHPVINEARKQAILVELRDDNKDARLDFEDEKRFPLIIDLLRELGAWIKNVANKFNEVMTLFKHFDEETRDALDRAQNGVNEAQKSRRMALGAAGSSGLAMAAGAGVLLAGGSTLSGSLMLSLGGGVAVWSYLFSGFLKEQAHDSEQLKLKIDELNKEGHILSGFTSQVDMKELSRELAQQMDTIQHPPPLLIDLMNSFPTIYMIFENVSKLDEEKKKVKMIHIPTSTVLPTQSY